MSAPVEVRVVGADELPGVLDEIVALESELFDDAWDGDALHDLVAGYGRRLHLATHGDGAVAGYVLTQVLGDFVDLLRIGVAPAARRGGVALALHTAAAATARREGAERVLLEVSEANIGARAFYDRLGYVEIDRRPGYYRDGSNALVLECTLPATTVPGNAPARSGEGE